MHDQDPDNKAAWIKAAKVALVVGLVLMGILAGLFWMMLKGGLGAMKG